jgi:hypothetical protein
VTGRAGHTAQAIPIAPLQKLLDPATAKSLEFTSGRLRASL